MFLSEVEKSDRFVSHKNKNPLTMQQQSGHYTVEKPREWPVEDFPAKTSSRVKKQSVDLMKELDQVDKIQVSQETVIPK